MPLIGKDAIVAPKANPVERPDYTEAQVQAVRALARGAASDYQQRLAMTYIIEIVCGTYDIAYRPTERDTTLVLGKQVAGQHLVWLVKHAESQNPRSEGEQP